MAAKKKSLIRDVMERFAVNASGTVREEKLEGRDYLVAPVAMLAEGVWTGSRGKVYYIGDRLANSVPGWDHKPAVVYHPQDKDGRHVSACTREVIETRKCGIILNTDYDDKLRTEFWCDVVKTRQVDARVVTKLERGEAIECSTGLILDLEKGEGTFGDKDYDYTADNFRPDHLAILPDKLGAYSIADGGGVMTTNALPDEPEVVLAVLRRSADALARSGRLLVGNELSFSKISCQLAELLAAKYGEPGKYWDGSIRDVFTNRVVFCDGPSYDSLLMIDYALKGDQVSLSGEAVKVDRVVEYKAGDGEGYVGNSAGGLVPKTKEVTAMAFDKKKRVAALVAAGVGTEEFLNKQTDEVLEGLSPPKEKEPEVVKPVDNEKKGEKVETPAKPKLTWNEIKEAADPATLEALEDAVEVRNAQKAKLVGFLVKNGGGAYTKEELEAMPVKQLRKLETLAKSLKKPAENEEGSRGDPLYVGAGAGSEDEFTDNEAEDPDAPKGGLLVPNMFPVETAKN
jgi:hypothetical protein